MNAGNAAANNSAVSEGYRTTTIADQSETRNDERFKGQLPPEGACDGFRHFSLSFQSALHRSITLLLHYRSRLVIFWAWQVSNCRRFML